MIWGVLQFPGSCDERDALNACEIVGGEARLIWHEDRDLGGVDGVVVPGGFSYGDYLRCGAMASQSAVMKSVKAHADKGGMVLGICNGFQVLTESHMLPGALMRNAGLKFVCRPVGLEVEETQSGFTRRYEKGQRVTFPVAHGEGNYEADEETVKRLEGEGRVLYRYCSADGVVDESSNINGAAQSIAGIVNQRGNVLGMMPHPENHVEDIMGCTDGRGLFAGLVAHLEKAA